MPKKRADFTAPLNVLVEPSMKEMLVAVGFFRGAGGSFGAVSRDMIREGLNHFLAGLSEADKKRFKQIQDNVAISSKFKSVD